MESNLEAWEIAVRRSLINHADLRCLRRYRRGLLKPLQSDLLQVLTNKIARFPDYFARKDQCYRKTAGLVLMSDWDRMVDFVTCMDEDARREFGVMHAKRPVLNCRFWRLCDHDAWRREMDLQCRFLREFDDGLWLFMTFSFTGFLPMASGYLNCSEHPISHADLITHWDAIKFTVDKMESEGIVRGAILAEEIHLESLYPVPVVTPHSHVVALVDSPLCQSHIEQIKRWLAQFRGRVMDFEAEANDDARWLDYSIKKHLYKIGHVKTRPRKPPILMETDPRLRMELPISLDLRPLPTQKDFSNGLGYLAKPIPLAAAYQWTRERLIRENPEGLELLAQSVNDFIIGTDLLLTPRGSPVYFGQCDARRRKLGYVGAPGKMLQDEGYRIETKALLKKLGADPPTGSEGPDSIPG